jgi:receptor protein-tyrosine kinase
VGAARTDGRSHLAASLAIVFSQLGQRTLLIDADMRHASQHVLFGLENRAGLSTLLAGRAGQEAIQRVPGMADLSILTAGAAPPNPADLLERPRFTQLLRDAAKTFDVVLLDTPCTAECADAYWVARHAKAALMVMRQDLTRVAQAAAAAEKIKQVNAVVLGAVFNDF